MNNPIATSWDHLTGTSDVPSELSTKINEQGEQILYFNVDGEFTFELPLDHFLMCWRLFNMVYYSRIINDIDICINTECRRIPYGAHQRRDECPGKSPWQRQQDELHNSQMRELRRQEKLRIASLGGEDGN